MRAKSHLELGSWGVGRAYAGCSTTGHSMHVRYRLAGLIARVRRELALSDRVPGPEAVMVRHSIVRVEVFVQEDGNMWQALYARCS
jgi:hypothetical protein